VTGNPLIRWRRKVLTVLLLVLLAPFLLAAVVEAVETFAQLLTDALSPLIPFALALVLLCVVYRLVLGRR